MRALIVGWFSFAWYGATAGDLLAAEVVEGWLDDAGCPSDRAVTAALGSGVDLETVEPSTYTHLVFVCGPLGAGEPVIGLLDRFDHCRRIAVDVSMLQPLDQWQPFDLLLERDSDRTARPDISLLADVAAVPVVALVLVHEQQEYDGRHAEVHAVLRQALAEAGVAVVEVDTCFDPPNAHGLTTPAQVVAVLGRVDAVVTTRLHGLVLGLKAGVPVVAVDPVPGGAKVAAQAGALQWPELLLPEQVHTGAVRDALTRCLAPEARDEARTCARRAVRALSATRKAFLANLHGG